MAETTSTRWGRADTVMALLLAAAAATGTWGLTWGWHVAPVERTLKMSQKIFYFHAPLGIWTLVLSVLAAIAAATYLVTREPRWDLACEAAVEVSTACCAVVLVTGSLWARPAWDDWFPWGEPRLTSMLVLFLLDLAYLVLRSSVDEPQRRARFSCVLAVVAALDAVLAYFAIQIWNTQHPRVITGDGLGLQHDMKVAFYVSLAAMALLVGLLVHARYRLALLRVATDRMEDRVEDALETAR